MGYVGVFLTGFSDIMGGINEIVSTACGIILIAFSVWQKWQAEKRTIVEHNSRQKEHELRMQLIQKIVNKEIDVDASVLTDFIKG